MSYPQIVGFPARRENCRSPERQSNILAPCRSRSFQATAHLAALVVTSVTTAVTIVLFAASDRRQIFPQKWHVDHGFQFPTMRAGLGIGMYHHSSRPEFLRADSGTRDSFGAAPTGRLRGVAVQFAAAIAAEVNYGIPLSPIASISAAITAMSKEPAISVFFLPVSTSCPSVRAALS